MTDADNRFELVARLSPSPVQAAARSPGTRSPKRCRAVGPDTGAAPRYGISYALEDRTIGKPDEATGSRWDPSVWPPDGFLWGGAAAGDHPTGRLGLRCCRSSVAAGFIGGATMALGKLASAEPGAVVWPAWTSTTTGRGLPAVAVVGAPRNASPRARNPFYKLPHGDLKLPGPLGCLHRDSVWRMTMRMFVPSKLAPPALPRDLVSRHDLRAALDAGWDAL